MLRDNGCGGSGASMPENTRWAYASDARIEHKYKVTAQPLNEGYL